MTKFARLLIYEYTQIIITEGRTNKDENEIPHTNKLIKIIILFLEFYHSLSIGLL